MKKESSPTTPPAEAGLSTRARLLDAAMELFAERGYDGASVGEIERAAGLAPRSGALYHHFSGKAELLEQAIERRLEAVDDLASAIEMLPLGNFRAELTLLGRWNLASLERRASLIRFVDREGDRLSGDLRQKLEERLLSRPYAQIVGWLQERLGPQAAADIDLDAVALVLIESMPSYRRIRDTFGEAPGGVDDDRFIAAWVDVCAAYAASVGLGD
ncbi:MAG: helix-turn-helix domain-containing protein [Solirubrobacterales bacterium]